MYTYDVQYADFEGDQKKEMGPVDASGAINAFRSFPFLEQYERAQSLPDGTAPTISFRSQSDEAVLAVWILEPNVYDVYLELSDGMVTVTTSDESFIIQAITSFFSGSRDDLFKKLAKTPGAVTKQGLLKRINSLWSS
jgi:hypothetical protein